MSLKNSYLCGETSEKLTLDIMKKTIFAMLLAALTLSAKAQENDSTLVTADAVDVDYYAFGDSVADPSFPGGSEALAKYFKRNKKYPELPKMYGVEGDVVITFNIERDGTLTGITAHSCKYVIHDTYKFGQLDEATQTRMRSEFALRFANEGKRLVSKMPKWYPGQLDNEQEHAEFSLPIHFRMPEILLRRIENRKAKAMKKQTKDSDNQ